MRLRRILVWTVAAGMASGCSPGRMAVRQAIDMSIRALPAYDRETDVEFGGQAVAGHIKLLEGLLESAPDDPELLLALTRSYSRYAFGYVQLKIDCAVHSGSVRDQQRWTDQAVDFYARARGYGTRLLGLAHPALAGALDADLRALARELNRFEVDEAPALFWTAFAWGNELACLPITPQSLGALGKTALLMHRVVELDEQVMCGSAHLYLGSYYSRLPKMWGGDAARADAHFRRAREIDTGSYLPASLLQAEYAWHTTGDSGSYALALRDLVESTVTSNSQHNLDNAIARRKARIRLAGTDSSCICECAVVATGQEP